MSEPDTAPRASLAEYLCARLPVQIFIVGDLPQQQLALQRTGVFIHQASTVNDALSQAEQAAPTVSEELSASDQLPATHTGGQKTAARKKELMQMLVLDLPTDQDNRQLLLGKAVRGFPDCVIVRCGKHQDSAAEDAAFFALGFNRLPLNPADPAQSETCSWFEYRLSQYKAAPQWLNARFWANPERFNDEEEPDIYCDDADDDDE